MAEISYFLFFFLLMAAGMGVMIFLLLKRKPAGENESMLMLQQQLSQLREVLDNKLSESSQIVQAQFNQSFKVITDVTEKLTKLDETNKQVVNFAVQLQNLQDILKNPKQRGALGEFRLELLLERAFTPKQYTRQYEFKNGDKVDFALFIGDKILPIDSKFSLENYNRLANEKDPAKRGLLEKTFSQDLKSRIDETGKYIRPQEGTFDFALMFIPAEGIYYDLMINEVGAMKSNTRDLVEYAAEKKVSIVSPNSFYAMLKTILQGLKAFHIEKSALEVRKNVEMLGQHLAKFDEFMQRLGNNLSTSVNAYNTAYKELAKIDKDVVRISEGERRIEPLQIDRPSVD
jgi:DNA recombination protein RmuC